MSMRKKKKTKTGDLLDGAIDGTWSAIFPLQ